MSGRRRAIFLAVDRTAKHDVCPGRIPCAQLTNSLTPGFTPPPVNGTRPYLPQNRQPILAHTPWPSAHNALIGSNFSGCPAPRSVGWAFSREPLYPLEHM